MYGAIVQSTMVQPRILIGVTLERGQNEKPPLTVRGCLRFYRKRGNYSSLSIRCPNSLRKRSISGDRFTLGVGSSVLDSSESS